MAKLDAAKESLNNHRLALTFLVGLEVVLVGSVVTSYRSGVMDLFYWLGLDLSIFVPFIMVYVTNGLITETQKLEGL